MTLNHRPKLLAALGLLFLLLLFVIPSVWTNPQAVLPTNFAYETVLDGLTLPVDVAITPDGDLIVAEKGVGEVNGSAEIYIYTASDSDPILRTLLTLPTNPFNDAGIHSITLDPDFADNGYFFVYYSTRGIIAELPAAGVSVNRASRFTLDFASLTASLDSEVVMLDNIPRGIIHNGGAMWFDDAGLLYVATGDVGRATETAAQLSSLNGKILRVLPTDGGGIVPGDNPFVGVAGAEPEIYARGLRNPFRMTKADGQVIVADVGAAVWEEANIVSAGADYGWPEREGPCPNGQVLPCSAADSRYTDPTFFYRHETAECCTGGAITGIAYYDDGRFPDQYHGQLFFVDFNNSWMGVADIGQGQHFKTPFANEMGSIVDMEFSDGAIYAVDIVAGTVSRLVYGGVDSGPIAEIEASSMSAPAPHTVTFTATNQLDQSVAQSYSWDFGDGTLRTTTTPTTRYTYWIDGDYTASVRIRDTAGAQSPVAGVAVQVYSGERPTLQLTNSVSATRATFNGGDSITFAALRSTMADLDPVQPFSWRIDLQHNAHVHPILTSPSATGGVLDVPIANHGDTNMRYELRLFMHTLTGQTVEVSRLIEPTLTTMQIATEPLLTPGSVAINDVSTPLPASFDAIVGVQQKIELPRTILSLSGDIGAYSFERWLTGPLVSAEISFRAEAGDPSYTALFNYVGPIQQSYAPVISR